LFGIDLLRNFAFPYFSRDIAEFWRRWHISLSSWFKDYLYIPLGGSKGGLLMKIRNTFIIFIVSGFWHGANWTFIVWGFLNALFIMPSIVFNTNRNNLDIVAKGKYLPTIKEFLSICFTFSLTVFAWIFFRASSVTHALSYLSKIFSSSLFSFPQGKAFIGGVHPITMSFLVAVFILIEWLGREQQYAIAHLGINWHKPVRWSMYYAIILIIYYFAGNEQQFIYFQF
jgi:D-alanyl-lipoteichoic acid acyltransferase DltB (MBOAT superfamily)